MAMLSRRSGPCRGWVAATALALVTAFALPLPARGADPVSYVNEERIAPPLTGDLASGFGSKVAISGERLVAARGQGLEYYRLVGTRWVRQHRFEVTGYASQIAVSGDTLAVAQPDVGSGRVLIYQLDQPEADPVVLTDPDPAASAHPAFGQVIALDGDRLIVRVEIDEDAARPRAAVIFERTGNGWVPAPGLALPSRSLFYGDAAAVGVRGDLAVVKSTRYTHVFERTAAGWSEVFQGSDFRDPVYGAWISDRTVLVSTYEYVPAVGRWTAAMRAIEQGAGGWGVSWSALPLPSGQIAVAADHAEFAVVDGSAQRVLTYAGTGQPWTVGPPVPVPQPQSSVDALAMSGSRMALGQPYATVAGFYVGQVSVLRRGGEPVLPPGAPHPVTVTASRSRGTATVRWALPGGRPVENVVVRATPALDRISETAVVVRPSTATSATITGLRELAPYTFSVQPIGPGGDGGLTRSRSVTLGGPPLVDSPHTIRDPRDDHGGGRKDLTSARLEINGRVATVRVRTARPQNPYTSDLFKHGGGELRILLHWQTPRTRTIVVQHQSTNPKVTGVPGEDFLFRGPLGTPCRMRGARYVARDYVANVPVSCLDRSRWLRLQVGMNYSGDRTAWSPPVRRVTQRGAVALGEPQVRSSTVGATRATKVTIRVKAHHRSGIRSAVIRAFSTASEAAPIRAGATRCARARATTSYCSMTFTVVPGELRNPDAGSWRVFAQVRARSGAVAVREQAGVFPLRHRTTLTAQVTRGSSVRASGRLTSADWDRQRTVALPRGRVSLQVKRPGSRSFTTVASVRTGSDGRFAVSSGSRSGTWRLRFAGTSTQGPVAKTL